MTFLKCQIEYVTHLLQKVSMVFHYVKDKIRILVNARPLTTGLHALSQNYLFLFFFFLLVSYQTICSSSKMTWILLPIFICINYSLCMECPPWSVLTFQNSTQGIISSMKCFLISMLRFSFHIASRICLWLNIHHIIFICLFLPLECGGYCVLNLHLQQLFLCLTCWIHTFIQQIWIE